MGSLAPRSLVFVCLVLLYAACNSGNEGSTSDGATVDDPVMAVAEGEQVDGERSGDLESRNPSSTEDDVRRSPTAAQVPQEKADSAHADTARVVGTITMIADGQRWVFDVVEGPIAEGYATGFNRQPRGEAVALGAQLHGRHRGSEATLQVGIGVWRETGTHMCDPFANVVEFGRAGRGSRMKLRPGDVASETCPPPEEGMGGLSIHLNLTEAVFDEEADSLHVAGTFSGPLGRGEEAMQVSEGGFEATLRSFEQLQ